jgi:hypothetical protein
MVVLALLVQIQEMDSLVDRGLIVAAGVAAAGLDRVPMVVLLVDVGEMAVRALPILFLVRQ